MILAILACHPQPQAQQRSILFEFNDPTITSLSITCSEDQWTVLVDSDSWTSNGSLWMAKSIHHYEKHPLYSISAAEDGSSDALQVILEVVWNEQSYQYGEDSAYLCSELEELSIAASITSANDNQVSDCVYMGTDIWGEFPDVDECELWIE